MVMKTKVAATYVAGQFKPDEDLPLADDTRVTLTVEVIENDLVDDEPGPSPQESKAAWERLQARLKERPIHGGGKRYTRDELHERR